VDVSTSDGAAPLDYDFLLAYSPQDEKVALEIKEKLRRLPSSVLDQQQDPSPNSNCAITLRVGMALARVTLVLVPDAGAGHDDIVTELHTTGARADADPTQRCVVALRLPGRRAWPGPPPAQIIACVDLDHDWLPTVTSILADRRGQHPSRTPLRWLWLAGALSAVVLTAATIEGHPISSTPKIPAPADASTPRPTPRFVPEAPLTPQAKEDGADPKRTGCASDPGTATTDTVEVNTSREQHLGNIELRYSPGCHVAWGRFTPSDSTLLPHSTVRVTLQRSGAEPGTTVFEIPFDGQPVFGNILTTTSGCVQATVEIDEHPANDGSPPASSAPSVEASSTTACMTLR
jgi:hypothetical protein